MEKGIVKPVEDYQVHRDMELRVEPIEPAIPVEMKPKVWYEPIVKKVREVIKR